MLSQELTTTRTWAIVYQDEIVIVLAAKTTLEFVHVITIDRKQLRSVRSFLKSSYSLIQIAAFDESPEFIF